MPYFHQALVLCIIILSLLCNPLVFRRMEAMSFSKAVSEMEKVVESAPANKPVRWDHWAQVAAPLPDLMTSISISHFILKTIRKTTVVAKYKAAAANLKPRKIQNTWSPVLKQNLQKIVDASNAQKVRASLDALSMYLITSHFCLGSKFHV
jgi:hypothetical protein